LVVLYLSVRRKYKLVITVLHASGVSQNLGLKEFVQNDMLHIPDNILEHLPPGTLSIIHLCSWTPLSTNSPTFTFEMESSNISWAEILMNISTDFLEVIALYSKGNHSSSPHAWVPKADSISDVSRTLVEIFCFDDIKHDSIIFHKFWPHSSLHNACKYQLLPSTSILCFIGSGSIMSDYDVDVPVYRLTGIHANISVSIINTSVVIKAAVNMLEKGS